MSTKPSSKCLLFSFVLVTVILTGLVTQINGSDFTITEATIDDLQKAFADNKLTSTQLVQFYLERIRSFNPIFRSVLEVNPDAIAQAEEADRQRRDPVFASSLGPLHGIPVLLKDSIATDDKLNTSLGSFALLGSKVPRDAHVVEKLRRAGAVILGKAALSELARGATVVDNIEIPNISIIQNPLQSGEIVAISAEFKLNINKYLKELISSPVRSLADIIQFNIDHPHLEMTEEYGQEQLIASEMTSGLGEEEIEAIKKMEELSEEGFEKVMKENELDGLVTLGSKAAIMLSIGGYPAITVPGGYDESGMPFGICFGGLKGTEPKLIQIAFDFEQSTKARKPPPSLLASF